MFENVLKVFYVKLYVLSLVDKLRLFGSLIVYVISVYETMNLKNISNHAKCIYPDATVQNLD